MAPLDLTDPAESAATIIEELGRFSPALTERERWLVLNKADQLPEDELQARVDEIVARIDWKGPVYVVSALAGQGTEKICYDIMDFLEARAERIQENPEYAAQLAELDERIESEARAQLQALDDKRELRRTGVKAVGDVDEDDDFWDEDEDDGPEIIYVRD
jgi:GTP-binding protein